MMKKAIVTGPTGAVGIALLRELSEQGVKVLAVCRKGSRRLANIPSNPLIKVVECDLNELRSLPMLVDENYDIFYHLAWEGTFGDARNNTQLQLNNIHYTLDAVEVAHVLGCQTFVGAGSQAECGRVEGNLSVKTPPFPENGYGIAKLCAGQMSRILCEQIGVRHIWTRILSIYGPYDGEQTMIMSTIRALLNGQKPSLTKGEQQWDYLYSKDIGRAMVLLGEKGKNGKVYCIGSGQTRSLLDYIYTIRNEIDETLPLGIGEIPYGEKQVMYLCADISALREDTGFKPKYTFEEGIRETIEWARNTQSI